MHDIKESVDLWQRQSKKVVLATVVGTWGSSPRPIGAKMAINQDGQVTGSVSGGCVESAVIEEAARVLREGSPVLLEFGVADEKAWSVGLSCGGRLKVFVEALSPQWWQALWLAGSGGRRVATATNLKGAQSGNKLAWGEGGLAWKTPVSSPDLYSILMKAAKSGLREGRSTLVEDSGHEILVDCHLPKPRLVIVGGAHVAVALASFAATLGFSVILIDPRRVFANRDRFPGVDEIHHAYPQEVLPKLRLDAESSVAILTHDPKIDDPAMLISLPSPAPYVGVLSSRTTHAKRKARLLEAGLDPRLLERIQVPIGLNIGAKTPEEIALAVMAQIVETRNKSKQA